MKNLRTDLCKQVAAMLEKMPEHELEKLLYVIYGASLVTTKTA